MRPFIFSIFAGSVLKHQSVRFLELYKWKPFLRSLLWPVGLNGLITASIRRGMEVISLWHCWGGMEAQVSLTMAFSSSAFFGLLFLIFLLTIHHRFSMGFRSGEFSGQSSTPTLWSFNQLLVLLAVWAGAKSCWKMKSASLKSWSAEGSMKCSKIYW